MMTTIIAFVLAGQAALKVPAFVRDAAPFVVILAVWAFVMMLRRRS